MQSSVKIIQTSLNAAFLIAAVFLFGTPARANVVASPTNVNFGNQALGATSASIAVVVTNENRRSADITSASLPTAQFSFSGPSLPLTLSPGTSATFSVNFAPTAAQAYSGALAFTRSNGSTITVALSGMGINTAATQSPAIVTQPASQTVTTGQSATFNVAATGTAPITYQWIRNGAAIAGATSASYTTPVTTTADNNTGFTVRVANSAGSVISYAAMLTVNAAATNYIIYGNPTSLAFSVQVGGAATSSNITINDTTPSPLPFTLSADKPWITLSALSSSTRGGGAVLQFGVNPAGLAAGSYSGNVFLTASGVSNSPLAVPVTLTVKAAAAVVPAITAQPSNQTVTAGQTATFSVTATGTAPMTYQWKKGGVAISGATSSSYTTPAEVAADNYAQFTATVVNSAGTATSNPAMLTVNASAVAPAITTQPTSQTVSAGQAATFNVAATGTAPLTYQWIRNGAAVAGATSASYTTPVTTTADNNTGFTVRVANSTGSVISLPVYLSVNAATTAPPPSAVAPAITTQPTSQTVSAGQSATFNVAATGTAPMTFQWIRNGAAVAGATSASYTTPVTTTADNNTGFTVRVANSTGSVISLPVYLSVNAATTAPPPSAVAPAITTQPTSQTVSAGQAATFNVAATGTAPLTYQWIRNGAAVAGATSASYTTPVTTTADNNTGFTVRVANSTGSVISLPVYLNVNAATTAPPPSAVAPAITTQPTSQTVSAGQAATFNVAATGTAPITYQWIRNGAAVAGATSASYTTPVTTTADNNTGFTVRVANSTGSVISLPVYLSVNTATAATPPSAVAPAITAQPASQTVTVGQSATFNVAATGTTPIAFQWMKNGSPISGAVSSFYTTPAATAADNSTGFTVNVTNSAGTATSSSAVLTVTASVAAPTITTQPSNKSVLPGQTAAFSVTATGAAPITYQWSRNGSAISGATSSAYTTPATTSADNNAQFTVAVSNSVGNVTSSPAILTVGTATLVLNANPTALNFGSVNMSSSNNQTATLTNSGNANITISNVSVSGAGFIANGVSTGLILAPGQSATLNATFTPASSGNLTGSVTIASNASNSPGTIALSGTGVAAVNHSVSLSWSASASSVMGYNAYSSKVPGGPYTKLNSSLTSAMSYTDSSVQSGQTYYYVVTAVDSKNTESAFSSEISALVP